MSDDETPLLGGIQAETGPVVRVAREGASSGGRSRGSSSSSGGRCCGVRRVDRRWLAAALALGLVLLSLALALSFRKPSHPCAPLSPLSLFLSLFPLSLSHAHAHPSALSLSHA